MKLEFNNPSEFMEFVQKVQERLIKDEPVKGCCEPEARRENPRKRASTTYYAVLPFCSPESATKFIVDSTFYGKVLTDTQVQYPHD